MNGRLEAQVDTAMKVEPATLSGAEQSVNMKKEVKTHCNNFDNFDQFKSALSLIAH